MMKFLSSMSCTCEIHSFLLGELLGNLMRIRDIGVEWTWLGWPLA